MELQSQVEEFKDMVSSKEQYEEAINQAKNYVTTEFQQAEEHERLEKAEDVVEHYRDEYHDALQIFRTYCQDIRSVDFMNEETRQAYIITIKTGYVYEEVRKYYTETLGGVCHFGD